MNKKLIISFLYISNTFIYKQKEYLKDKNQKYVIDYSSLLDKTIDKTNIEKNKVLVGALILKKIRKILGKPSVRGTRIYYVLKDLNDDVIENVKKTVSDIYNGEIELELYTDFSSHKSNIDKLKTYSIEKLRDVS